MQTHTSDESVLLRIEQAPVSDLERLRDRTLQAKRLIDRPSLWIKGRAHMYAPSGFGRDRYCIFGTLVAVTTRDPAYGQTLRRLFGIAVRNATGYVSVPSFNDSPRTLHPDVMRIYDFVAQYLEERIAARRKQEEALAIVREAAQRERELRYEQVDEDPLYIPGFYQKAKRHAREMVGLPT